MGNNRIEGILSCPKNENQKVSQFLKDLREEKKIGSCGHFKGDKDAIFYRFDIKDVNIIPKVVDIGQKDNASSQLIVNGQYVNMNLLK